MPQTLRSDGRESPDGVFWTTRDGTQLHVRPIEPADEQAMIAFHQSLSDGTVYSRYFACSKLSTRILHERLRHICTADPLIEVVLIAETTALSGPAQIVAVARLCHKVGGDAEVALLVTDIFQGRGLGTELFRRLRLIARQRYAGNMVALFLPSNAAMRHLCISSGMSVIDADGSESIATTALDPLPSGGSPRTAHP